MNTVARARLAPEVITIGKRQVISSGQFNVPLVATKLIEDGVNDWVSVSEIAKYAYGKSFLANNRRVRGKLSVLRRYLIPRGFLLITEGRPVEHLKIYVEASAFERQLAETALRKMRTRSDTSAAVYEMAERLVYPAVPRAS